jgi:hypothetical protein
VFCLIELKKDGMLPRKNKNAQTEPKKAAGSARRPLLLRSQNKVYTVLVLSRIRICLLDLLCLVLLRT